ncbi:MAG: peptidoglycan DD-metalloendopeptidase family protein [Oscillospiraceae bacterium]|nr:peptidoglycan DD-metalloendopeptidase family protein [Oscillospiraceae bacterium]
MMILSLFSGFGGALAASQEDQDKLADLKSRLTEIKDERKNKESALVETNAQINETLRKKYAIEQEIALIYEQIRLTEEIIQTLEDQIAQKEAELDAVEQARRAYGIGSKSRGDLNGTIARLDSLRQALKKDHADQEQQKKDYENYREELDAREFALSDIIFQLRTDAEFTRAEIEAMAADAIEVDKEILALSKKISADEQLEYLQKLEEWIKNGQKGENPGVIPPDFMSWPLPGFTTVSSGYQYRKNPVTGIYSFHTGIDIPAPQGTAIQAAASGTVVSAGWNNAYGWRIIINHGNGLQTMYAHMKAFAVQEGDSVNAGDTIGYVGLTGNTTGYHLHFSVLLNGSYVNPWFFVSV